jgi:PHP domain-containing protein
MAGIVNRLRAGSWFVLAAAAVSGTVSDTAPARPPIAVAGYQALAADLHVHTFPLSAATLAPWDVVIEARHQGLDVIAMTAHNQVWSGKIGRWFSRRIGGPTVLVGEEVHTPRYHLIAAGIHSTISWRSSAADAIRETHRQHGVAIAAHPTWEFWPGWEGVIGQLDGTEVLQPTAWASPGAAEGMHKFYDRAPLAPIGSSDYHGFAPLGDCRTYIFARDRSEEAILDAIRAHRTLVFDGDRVWGDPALARLAAGRLPEAPRDPGVLSRVSGILGLAGVLGVVCCGCRN